MDFKYAVRMLVKDRWFTLVALLALGLGIGLNATVFTIVNAVLIRGLPFHDADQILHINGRNSATRRQSGVSWLDFQDLRPRTTTFAQLGAYRPGNFTVAERGRPPERILGVAVSANTFDLLGQQPLRGRGFRPGEDGNEAAPVVILSFGVWQSRYAGDEAIIGRVITVNDVACTVVGVMPDGMRFPNNAELWRPLAPEGDDGKRRDARNLNLFGRLGAAATRGQAQAEMATLARQLEQQYPDTNTSMTLEVMSFNERFNGGPIRVVFLALLGAVGFVLLIACANVANLLLAKSATRAREIAVRFALGASRARVVRQLLVESVLLSCLGGVFGLGLALLGVRLFDAAVANTGKPYWIVFSFDPIVFGYFAAICLTTGIVFGLAPALQVSRTNVNETLKEGGRGTSGAVRARRLTSAMVVAEITLTLVLLVGAGLMIRSFLKLYAFELGADVSHTLVMRMQLPDRKYPTPETRRIFYDTLMDRLAAIPGMEAAAIASAVPFGGTERRALEIEGRPAAQPELAPSAGLVRVSPSYFDVLGLGMRRGRALRVTDGAEGSEVVVVNERFATQFFPGEEPVGRRIRFAAERASPAGSWLTIVGVSPTIRQGDPQSATPDAVMYLPYRMQAPGFMHILTRSRVQATSLTPLVREAVQAVDADQPVYQVQSMDEFLAQLRWPYRVFGSMFAIFALTALALSAVGIYAVTAYSVAQRTPEIGVRMALGARPGQVSWLILRQGLWQLALGVTLGLALAWPVSGVLQSLVVQISTKDPITFGIILAVLAVVTLSACLIPARRATHLDPLSALRID